MFTIASFHIFFQCSEHFFPPSRTSFCCSDSLQQLREPRKGNGTPKPSFPVNKWQGAGGKFGLGDQKERGFFFGVVGQSHSNLKSLLLPPPQPLLSMLLCPHPPPLLSARAVPAAIFRAHRNGSPSEGKSSGHAKSIQFILDRS